MKHHLGTEEEVIEFGASLAETLSPGTVIGLRGGLGSGKTTLTKGIAKGLEIIEPIVSPTYTLLAEYSGTFPLYHFDLYRISSEEEFPLIGGEEILYSGNGISVIEWCDLIPSYLPADAMIISINILPQGREIVVGEKE